MDSFRQEGLKKEIDYLAQKAKDTKSKAKEGEATRQEVDGLKVKVTALLQENGTRPLTASTAQQAERRADGRQRCVSRRVVQR